MKKISLIIIMLLLLSACSKELTLEKRLVETLTSVNEKEKEGLSYVKKLNQQERKEQKLFNKTMELSQEQYEEVKVKVASLKKSARERTVIIEKEQEALSKSRKVAKMLSEMAETTDPDEKKALDQLIDVMTERYNVHEELILDYKKLIDTQTQLYTQLEDREIRASQLRKQVTEVNSLTSDLQKKIGELNDSTSEVNRIKSRILTSLEHAK